MAHIHELIDYTAGVYVVYKDKVLIRKHEKYHIWIHVGGHVELNEHPIEAAIREVYEEVGLKITIPGYSGIRAKEAPAYSKVDDIVSLPPPQHMNIHRINETHQHLDMLYYALADTDMVVPENPADQWVWLTTEEVANHPEMGVHTKEYALGALKALGTSN